MQIYVILSLNIALTKILKYFLQFSDPCLRYEFVFGIDFFYVENVNEVQFSQF